MRPVAIVDLSSVLVPYWFALLSIGPNVPTAAVANGTVCTLDRILYGTNSIVFVCCDVPGYPTWRKAAWPGYKSKRPPWPSELVAEYQAAIDQLRKRSGHCVLSRPGFEADDIAATVHARIGAETIIIITSDKDLMALVNPNTSVYAPKKKTTYDLEGVHSFLGVWPHQVTDYLAMVGDSTDGVPGIMGVGHATAVRILERFGTFNDALIACQECPAKELSIKARDHKLVLTGWKDFEFWKHIVSLRTDVPIKEDEIEIAISK